MMGFLGDIMGLALAVIIAAVAAWVYTLYRTASKDQWEWFAITLISGLGMIVYWILVMSKKVK